MRIGSEKERRMSLVDRPQRQGAGGQGMFGFMTAGQGLAVAIRCHR